MSQTAVARAVSGVAVVVLTLAAAGCRADAPSPTAAPVTAPTAAPPTAAVVVKPPVATAIVAQATTAPTVTAPPTTASTLAAPPTAGPAAAQPTSPAGVQTGFVRPDVAPLPPAGRFQVISQTPWPGEKVRVFFLGAQF